LASIGIQTEDPQDEEQKLPAPISPIKVKGPSVFSVVMNKNKAA